MAVLQKKKSQSHLMCVTDYIRNTLRKSNVEVLGVWEKNGVGQNVFRMRPAELPECKDYLEVYDSPNSIKIKKVRASGEEEYTTIKKAKQISTTDLPNYVNELKKVFKEDIEEANYLKEQEEKKKAEEAEQERLRKEALKKEKEKVSATLEIPVFTGGESKVSVKSEKTRQERVSEKVRELLGDEGIDNVEEDTSFQGIVDEVTKKRCNICKLQGRDDSYTTLSLRYAGKDAKIALLYIAEKIYEDMVNTDTRVLMSMFGNSDDIVNKFIISQAENVYTFMRRSKDSDVSMSISIEDKVKFALMLKEVGTYYNVGRYVAYANNILVGKDREDKILDAVRVLKGMLHKEGITYQESRSATTTSVYLVLDSGKLGKIRIADHERSADIIPYNVVMFSKRHGYFESEAEDGSSLETYYSTGDSIVKDLERVVATVVADRNEKVMNMGMVAYNS